MKTFLRLFLSVCIISIATYSCKSSRLKDHNVYDDRFNLSDTIAIVNEDVDYEIIIIDAGFNVWLQSTAQPRGYFSQNYLEIQNYRYVTSWNIRVNNPARYPNSLYNITIDYDQNIDYGYEVNYLLYNYFLYFQKNYHQTL
ncbi:DUF6146 family protein [Wenyingzhuangia sp. IMCC45533]